MATRFKWFEDLTTPTWMRTRQKVDGDDANLISSLADDSKHYPLLDIDFETKLVPSSTPGHYHLYLDKGMDYETYVRFMQIMAQYGIIEQKVVDALKRDGMNFLRLPGVQKTEEDRTTY